MAELSLLSGLLCIFLSVVASFSLAVDAFLCVLERTGGYRRLQSLELREPSLDCQLIGRHTKKVSLGEALDPDEKERL